eukprot:scaffold79144_cov69-Phaeocystis_antarctica.AAC.1
MLRSPPHVSNSRVSTGTVALYVQSSKYISIAAARSPRRTRLRLSSRYDTDWFSRCIQRACSRWKGLVSSIDATLSGSRWWPRKE